MTDGPEKARQLTDEKRALLEKRRKGLGKTSAPAVEPIKRLPPDTPRYASFGQERLWYLHQLQPSGTAYHMTSAVKLTGSLDKAAFREALQTVVDRHEALRTTFSLQDGALIQQVAAKLRVDIIEATSAEDQVAHIANQPFDLAHGPLFRAALLRSGEDVHIAIIVMHHIISDEWSLEILWRETAAAYEALLQGASHNLPSPSVQYSDFAAWQRTQMASGAFAGDLHYWQSQLAGDLPLLQLPTDYPRPPVQHNQGGFVTRLLPTEVGNGLTALSRDANTTLFVTLVTAFQVFLHRYTGQPDILVGTPVTNRTQAAVESVIGFFLNTVVLRADLSHPISFAELLARQREQNLNALAHQGLPFDHLVEALHPHRDPSHTPIFQAMFVYQDGEPPLPSMPGLKAEAVVVDAGVSKFDLTLFARSETHGIQLSLEYDAGLFERQTAERMLLHFETLLAQIASSPSTLVGRLNILPDDERRTLLVEWTRTAADFPRALRIHDMIAGQPSDAPAVIFGSDTLTYGELNALANQLAQRLIALGLAIGTPVGLCVERSFAMVVGILGILKAGGAYVPIDPAYPQERTAHILEDAEIRILLTQDALVDRLPRQAATALVLDDIMASAGQTVDAPETGVTPDDLAYMIYTSGSTGLPKGVRVSHRNLVHSTTARFAYYNAPSLRFLLLSSFAFDSSVAGIFWTLCQGGVLCLPPPQGERDVHALATIIARNQVSHTLMLPSLYSILLEFAQPDHLASLRGVIVAGEACPLELPARHYRLLPDCGLYNEYGPTEATVWSTVWQIPAQFTRMLIGRAIPNMQTYILDGERQPVPIGVVGELYLGGEGITQGYHKRPDLTAERFIANPFGEGRLYRTGDLARYMADGTLEFLGRADQQVKINGYRIELGEVESILASYPGVQEAVVLTLQADSDIALTNHEALETILREIEAMSEDEAAAQLRTLR